MGLLGESVDSPLKRVGGKKKLRKKVIELLPDDAACYVEVFGGAAWVLFGKQPHPVEVLNDSDGDLMNLWRVIKWRPSELMERVQFELYARERFNEVRDQETPADEMDRAVDMYLLMHMSFTGRLDHATFGTWSDKYRALFLTKGPEKFAPAAKRLANVFVERKDFEALIKQYDRKGTIFFCDPPYYKLDHYTESFSPQDHERLAFLLRGVQGRFLLTINDCPEVRSLYTGLHVREEQEVRSCAAGGTGRGRQAANILFVSNYSLAQRQEPLGLTA